MDTSAVAGDSKIVRRNQSKFQRRDDGSNGKKLLKSFFIMEREVPIL